MSVAGVSTMYVALDESVWDGHVFDVCDTHSMEVSATGDCPWC